MAITHIQLREKFSQFWEEKGHKWVPPIPLVPQNDPTTLFTGSGMQQLVPFLLGEPHPLGEKLYNIQPCFRAQDIEEIGDNRHTTSFEMMGNWSLGTYFKKEQLSWFFEFLVEYVKLPPEKLYVTVFMGEGKLPADEESIEIWKSVFRKYGIEAKLGERIFQYDATKNWWSRAGIPDNMPAGEPGGPDSEVFYDFGEELRLHENSPWKNENCHVNCDCGRFLEIGNSVFMQYKKLADGSFEELPKKNVDFGGGLERILAASHNNIDVFVTDLYKKTIETIEKITDTSYQEEKNKPAMRVIADHLKAATFIIIDGVRPANKEQGYVLRRLLRRSAVKFHQLGGKLDPNNFIEICNGILETYNGVQGVNKDDHKKLVVEIISDEIKRFSNSLERGLREISKLETVNGKIAFDFYQSYGFPLELTEELFKEKGVKINRQEFYDEFNKHKELSRTSSAGKFKGGLADHSDQTIKYHTATHLLHQALFDVMGNDIRQEGSNITAERLRFDFYSLRKPTDEETKKIETIINDKIQESLPMTFKMMPKEDAYKIGAKSFFREKYPDTVKVYYIGKDIEHAYSKEFCGGPHVINTKEIGKLEIYKLEKIGSNLYRIYAR